MNAREAFGRLRRLGVPVIRTADAAAALGLSKTAATMTLSRLVEAGLVSSVRHGTWWVDGAVDPYRLPEHLTAPLESYLSLHTALHLHGLIEQIPEILYAVTLGRTQRVTTRAGTFSFHHVAPEVFGGFEETGAGVKLATAEKALFDFAYLSAGRSRIFATLPELEIPRGFREREVRRWVQRIPSARSRTLTESQVERFLRAARGAAGTGR
jgi:predicted transcriptional regulator of viral defense system